MVRPVKQSEINILHSMMLEFAKFDGTEDEFSITPADLRKALFVGESKLKSVVVEFGGHIVGFLNYFLSFGSFHLDPTIWVEDVYIKESFRGEGLGKQLFAYIRDVAKEENISKVEWLVRKDNQDGIRFYERIGAHVYDNTFYVKWNMD